MIFSLIPLPANFTAQIVDNATSILGDLSPYATLIIGVLLGVVLLEILINAIRR